jgi:hypothetical protein
LVNFRFAIQKTGGTESSSGRVAFCLEGVSKAEIDLHKVVRRPIDNVITGFTEKPDMGCKAILKSSANVAEYSIAPEVVADRIKASTCDSDRPGFTCYGIGHEKVPTDCVPVAPEPSKMPPNPPNT